MSKEKNSRDVRSRTLLIAIFMTLVSTSYAVSVNSQDTLKNSTVTLGEFGGSNNLENNIIDISKESKENGNEEISMIQSQKDYLSSEDSKKCKSVKAQMNREALEVLTSKNLEITKESLEGLNPYLDSSVIKLDIFQGENLSVILKEVLKFILNDKGEITRFDVTGKTEIKEGIEQLIEYLGTEDINKDDKDVEILKNLSNIKKLMENDDTAAKNSLYSFIKAIGDAYNINISRRIADTVLEENRDRVQKAMGSTTINKEVGVSGVGNVYGGTIGGSISYSSSESPTETSFYSVNSSGSLRLSVGAGFNAIVSAEIGGNIGITKSAVFYSLEQYLDSDHNADVIYLRESDIEGILESRKTMKKKEKKLLSDFQVYIETYVKAVDIIPDIVYMEWPKITKSSSAEKSTTEKLGWDATVSLLESLGFKVSCSQDITKIKKPSPYLSLIQSDCSAAEALTHADISKFMAKKDGRRDGVYNKKIYTDVKNLIEVENQNIKGVLSLIIGDLRRYNYALSVLSTEEKDRMIKVKEKSIKHEIEDKWLVRGKIFKKEGRMGMLVASVVVATYLKDFDEDNEQISLFKTLYEEISRLSELQNFSNTKKSQDAGFDTSRISKSYNVDGTMNINVPVVGDVKVCMSYNHVKGAPFESGEEVTVSIKVPVLNTVAFGIDIIKEKFTSMGKKLSDIEQRKYSDLFFDALVIAKKELVPILSSMGFSTPNSFPISFSSGRYITLVFNMKKIEENADVDNVIALPDKEVIKKEKDFMALKFIKRIDSRDYAIGVNAINYAKFKVSRGSGKINSLIGNNTLSFITNRYNVFATGQNDRIGKKQGKSELWLAFKAGQKESFDDMLINIGNPVSNIRYEVQSLYNDAINEIGENKELLSSCENTYREFIDACEGLSSEECLPSWLEKASSLLDDVLEINYRYVFIPMYNREFSIKS